MKIVGFEWDPKKAAVNYTCHGVRFTEAIDVFDDDRALTMKDEVSDPEEERFITLGLSAAARMLVVVYTYRGERIRLISARLAEPLEREQYEESA